MRHFWAMAVAALVFGIVAPLSFANDFDDIFAPIDPKDRASGDQGIGFGLGFGAEVRDYDDNGNPQTFYHVNTDVDLPLGPLSIGLRVKLVFDHEWEFRDFDYDEEEDYLSIIRYVQWYSENVELRAGTLADGYLGHRTIVNHYITDVDWEHKKAGAQVNLDFGYFGFQTFTNNIYDFTVVGGRGYIRPLHGSELFILDGLSVGASYATDQDTPTSLKFSGSTPMVDDEGNREYNSEENVVVYGVDVELPILDNEYLKLIPYTDYNKIEDFGEGLHIGVLFQLKLPFAGENIKPLLMRYEWRDFDEQYLPQYFDALYEFERVAYPEADSQITKYQALNVNDGMDGYYGELTWGVLDLLTVRGSYEDYGQDSERRILMEAQLEPGSIPGISAKAMYIKKGMDTVSDCWTFDENAFFIGSVGYEIGYGMWTVVTLRRTWIIDETTGNYQPVDQYDAGVVWRVDF